VHSGLGSDKRAGALGSLLGREESDVKPDRTGLLLDLDRDLELARRDQVVRTFNCWFHYGAILLGVERCYWMERDAEGAIEGGDWMENKETVAALCCARKAGKNERLELTMLRAGRSRTGPSPSAACL